MRTAHRFCVERGFTAISLILFAGCPGLADDLSVLDGSTSADAVIDLLDGAAPGTDADPLLDAGIDLDAMALPDAAEIPDAGPGADAAIRPDAMEPPDAAPITDGGFSPDGGAPDTGAFDDAGPDAGILIFDAGPPVDGGFRFSGGFSTTGALGPAGGMRLVEGGFEHGARSCVGMRCVTGWIGP